MGRILISQLQYYILNFSITKNFLVTNLGSIERVEAILNSQIRFTHLTNFFLVSFITIKSHSKVGGNLLLIMETGLILQYKCDKAYKIALYFSFLECPGSWILRNSIFKISKMSKNLKN